LIKNSADFRRKIRQGKDGGRGFRISAVADGHWHGLCSGRAEVGALAGEIEVDEEDRGDH
jgi:hypothetical protein